MGGGLAWRGVAWSSWDLAWRWRGRRRGVRIGVGVVNAPPRWWRGVASKVNPGPDCVGVVVVVGFGLVTAGSTRLHAGGVAWQAKSVQGRTAVASCV